jgi:hypothetical protein
MCSVGDTDKAAVCRANSNFPSGQDVRKPKGGRPERGISKPARELPISGKTVETRRKTMERSKAIAGIFPKTKDAIKAAKLDNNQKALLEIGKQGTPYDEVKGARTSDDS